MSRAKFKQIASGLLLAVLASAASAGGMADMSTETTQIMNNVELVVQVKEQIKSNKKQIQQYETQLYQYYQQVADGTNVSTYYTNLGLGGLNKEMTAAKETRLAYDKLFGTVDQLSQEWQQRMIEASTQGIPVEKYIQNEADRIQKRNSLAIKRIEQERRIMGTIEEDFSLAKQWGDSISHQTGINSSIGLLNTQMNRMLQQNARMVQLMSQAQGSDKAREEQHAAEVQAQQNTLMKQMQAKNAAALKEVNSSIGKVNAGKDEQKSKFDFLNK